MNAAPRRILRQLLRHYGPTLASDPRRVEAFLCDLCGRHRREIFVLVHAQEERIPEELLSAGRQAGDPVHWQRLSKRLQDRMAFTAEAADWAVASWAEALDVQPARRRFPLSLPRPADLIPNRLHLRGIPHLAAPFQTIVRALGKVGVQLDNGLERRLPSYLRGRRKWVGSGGLALLLLAVLGVALSPAAGTSADGLAFWRQETPAWQPPSLDEAAAQLPTLYPLPRQAWLRQDLIPAHQSPSAEAGTVGLLGPPGAAITVDAYSADGRWSHLSAPVDGWVRNQQIAFAQEGIDQRIVLAPGLRRITDSGLRIRQRPDTDAPVLENLFAGEIVVVIAATEDGAWVQITAPVVGWISGQFVEEVAP